MLLAAAGRAAVQAALGKAGNIARNLIDFEVHLVADLALVPGGDLECAWDQHALRSESVDAVDGKRGAVERDRALGRDEFGERRRRLEDEAVVSPKSSRPTTVARASMRRWLLTM